MRDPLPIGAGVWLSVWLLFPFFANVVGFACAAALAVVTRVAIRRRRAHHTAKLIASRAGSELPLARGDAGHGGLAPANLHGSL